MSTEEANHRFELLLADIEQKFDGAKLKLSKFPSGAFMLDVFLRGQLFVVECTSGLREFGVSKVDENNSFSGADTVFQDFSSAAEHLKKLLVAQYSFDESPPS